MPPTPACSSESAFPFKQISRASVHQIERAGAGTS